MKHVPSLPRDDVNVPREHPLVEAGWLVVAIGLVVAALVVLAAFAGEALARFVPLETELRWLGAGDARDAEPGDGEAPAQAASSAHADAREVALQELADRLCLRVLPPGARVDVDVVEEDAPNALVLPGGRVFVTSALLDAAESENELAFVLAHELGHLVHRDAMRRLGREALVALLLSLTLGGSGGGAGLPAGVASLTSRGFDRAQERAADLFALERVAAAYGHVAGATRFFERLPDAHARAGDRLAGWLVTHPVSEDRIAQLHAVARERGWATDGELVPWRPAGERGAK